MWIKKGGVLSHIKHKTLLFKLVFLLTNVLIPVCGYGILLELAPYIEQALVFLKKVLRCVLFLYLIFNIYDLRNYKMVHRLGRAPYSLWYLCYINKKSYRLKELLYDLKSLSRFSRGRLSAFLILCITIPLSMVFISIYSLVMIPLVYINAQLLVVFLVLNFFSKGDACILKESVQPIRSLRNLLYHLFVLNPQGYAFGFTYLALKRGGGINRAFVVENILHTKLVGKSRWFLYASYTIGNSIKNLLLSEIWERKQLRSRVLISETFFNLNSLILNEFCSLHYFLEACKIKVVRGWIYLNPKAEVVEVLSKCYNFACGSWSRHIKLNPTLVNVGNKSHSGIGFIEGGKDKVVSQYVKTFNNKFRVKGVIYKSEEYTGEFRYPKNVCYSEDDLSPRTYAAKQYAVSSYFGNTCTKEDRSNNLSRAILDIQRDRALVERSLHLSKEIIKVERISKNVEILRNQLQILNLNRVVNPNNPDFSEERARDVWERVSKLESEKCLITKDLVIVQESNPSNGYVMSRKEVLTRLGDVESEFHHYACELSCSILNLLSGIEVEEKDEIIEKALSIHTSLTLTEYLEATSDGALNKVLTRII